MMNLLTTGYYLVKPFMPRKFRLHLRRHHARRIRKNQCTDWPIKLDSGDPAKNWMGWPDNHKFAFVLSHDVEWQIGLDRVWQLAEVEIEMGFRSSFNFVPEGGYRVPDELRQQLIYNGFEVGVHGLKHDGKLYRSKRIFKQRARKINWYLNEWKAVGFRSPLMHHNLEWLQDLNCEYDASTFDTDPFEPQPDGAETIFPFWVEKKSPGGDSGSGYVELPYTLPQDSTLFLVLEETGPEIWTEKVQWLAKQGGMVLLNLHPDYVDFADSGERPGYEYSISHYRDFLQFVKSNYDGTYWHALPREVAKWYRDTHVDQVPRGAA